MKKLASFMKNVEIVEPPEEIVKSPLKWLGGKTKLLETLRPLLKTNNSFFDVFGGSGVVSLNSQAPKIIYNDINKDLYSFYKHISKEQFIPILEELYKNNSVEKYYQIRENFNNHKKHDVERAAMFLYLNKCCFNGLCRYNKQGNFNAPSCKDGISSRTIPYDEIQKAKTKIAKTNIKFYNMSFEEILKKPMKGDVVYLDPPYLQSDEYDTMFTSYSSGGFAYTEHLKIVEEAERLQTKGVVIVISNSDTKITRDLYKNATEIIEIDVRRSVSSKKTGRKKVKELIAIYN